MTDENQLDPSEPVDGEPGGDATRRQFIQTLGLAAGATLAAGANVAGQACTPPFRRIEETYGGVIYTVTPGGELRFYKDRARWGYPIVTPGAQYEAKDWTYNAVVLRSNGWAFTKLVSGGDGTFYGLYNGKLYFMQDVARNGTAQFKIFTNPQDGSLSESSVIHESFSGYTDIISGGNGVLYCMSAGQMWYYKDLSRGSGPQVWDNNGTPRHFGNWSSYTKIVSGGHGVFYAITSGGVLHYYRDTARTGIPTWANGGAPVAMGTGWNVFTHVAYGGNGILYGVEANGDVRYFQDLSRDGSVNWHGKSPGQQIAATEGVIIRHDFHQLLFVMADEMDSGPIQGYASAISVRQGKSVDFHVRSIASQYDVSIVRVKKAYNTTTGKVSDDDASEMKSTFTIASPGLSTAVPATAHVIDDPEISTNGCPWPIDFSVTVPTSWQSGTYAARCSDGYGNVCYVPFIVTPALNTPKKTIAVLASTLTWAAYNHWGGRSNYYKRGGHPWPVLLNVRRPSTSATPVDYHCRPEGPAVTNENYNHWSLAEQWIHTWMEEEEFYFDLYSEHELHQPPSWFNGYKTIVITTHPEYWTDEMRTNLEAFLALPDRNLVYLGGNGLFERVTFHTVGYNLADEMLHPIKILFRNGGPNREPSFFRSWPSRPERDVLGVQFEYIPSPYEMNAFPCTYYSANVADPGTASSTDGARFFIGTGLGINDHFGELGLQGGASGIEGDLIVGPSMPPSGPVVQLLATSRGNVTHPPGFVPGFTYGSDMVYRNLPSGGFVFSVGSISFGGSLAVNATLQQIVRNVLNECM